MSDPLAPPPPEPEATTDAALGTPSVAQQLALWQRAGGIATPIMTAVLAFFIGGIVILVTTGKNPLSTYRGIFNGTGLNWLFPWVQGADRVTAAINFQQTLLLTTASS